MTLPEFVRWQDIPSDFSGFCVAGDDFYHCENGIITPPPSGGPAFIVTDDQRQIWVIPTDQFEPAYYNNKAQRIYKNHRLDGPAKIYGNGDCEFWINGNEYKPEEFWNHPLVIENKIKSILGLFF